uniref:Mating-type protein MAT1-1-2 n=1 Tax=Ophiostoma himal-ulmi TaxID=61193 RepID=W8PQF8_9PEZI|nr:mating-type protein MAT1-1-2 [Ophiostoma himal-ulmi]
MERTESGADRLVETPFHILQNASHLTETCQGMSSLSCGVKALVQSLFDDLVSHEEKQQEFLLARLHIKSLVEGMRTKDSNSAAAGVLILMDLYPAYIERLVACNAVLDDLILRANSLLLRFQILQACIDVPSTSTLRKFVTEQKAAYCAFRDKYKKETSHNSCRWRDAPGAEFGMKPFEEIVYAWDGTIMIWDNEFDDWGWLEHYHPCRYMPGSEWGKFYHDLTHGDFWVLDQRPIVDWTHAAPANAILSHLETEYRRASQTDNVEVSTMIRRDD